MEIFWTVLLSVVSVGATVMIHYEMLGLSARLARRLNIPRRRQVLATLAMIFVAHVLEISWYAAMFFLMHEASGLGKIEGAFEGTALDYFYFSISSFTTLGVGDVVPVGPIRVLTGVEALNGLVLIAWSATFTFISVQRRWDPS